MKKYLQCSAICLLLAVLLSISLTTTTQAAAKTTTKKAKYTITSCKDQKNGAHVTAVYSYQRPQLVGSGKVVSSINTALKKGYQQSLKDKKVLWGYASSSQFDDKYFTTTTCKVTYNEKGYVSFRFHHKWYAGGVSNIWTDGMTFSLKTGKKLNVSSFIKGSSSSVKQKIAKEYLRKVSSNSAHSAAIKKMKISEFDYYLKNGKVVVCFGPYQPAGGNGESHITLPGNY